MKNSMKKVAVAALLICSGVWVSAQVPSPGLMPSPPLPAQMAPGNVPPPPMPGAPQPGLLPNQQLQTLTTISGTVSTYLVNDRGVYDGLTLQTGSKATNVKFPDHMGKQLMDQAKKGSTLTLNGFNTTSPTGVNEFRLVSAKAGNSVITDTPPTPPVTTAAPQQKSYSGKISDLRRDAQGMINGIVLDNKDVVEIPPHVTSQLQPLLKTGEKVDVTGFKMPVPDGVVMAQAGTNIQPQTLTLNGQTYLVR